MWLLDTDTLKLCQISDTTKEKYAILSHTWHENEEITFQELDDQEAVQSKSGLVKVIKTCHIAKSKGFKYAWIDTCCIDKKSSAELSEAINSMFQWYKEAETCYVYLSDFEPLPLTLSEQRSLIESRLRKCRWFTRGWTLQELIAPKKIEFFDRDWNFIGGKDDLKGFLSHFTNIDESILRDSSGLHSIPIARKMSWATGRRTTRIEDRAYSLLGIFDINMPLLYGEGDKAFFRLQQQIANENNDLSLFAWQIDEISEATNPEFAGIFANSPDEFRHCSTLKKHIELFQSTREFSITNSGLRIGDRLHSSEATSKSDFLLSLDCAENSERTKHTTQWLAICLTKVGNKFLRHHPNKIMTAPSRTQWAPASTFSGSQSIYIQTVLPSDDAQRISSLMNTGVVVVYGDNLYQRLGPRSGLPAKSCAKSPEKHTFRFDARGSDNFLVHRFQLQPESLKAQLLDAKKYASDEKAEFTIACNLQWTGLTYQLQTVLLKDDELSFLCPGKGRSQNDTMDAFRDLLLTAYSDDSGYLLQEKMPTKLMICVMGRWYWLMVRALQRLEENPLGAWFTWKDGYYHILVDLKLANSR